MAFLLLVYAPSSDVGTTIPTLPAGTPDVVFVLWLPYSLAVLSLGTGGTIIRRQCTHMRRGHVDLAHKVRDLTGRYYYITEYN